MLYNLTLAEHTWGLHLPVDCGNSRVLDHCCNIHHSLVLYIDVSPENRNNGSIDQVYIIRILTELGNPTHHACIFYAVTHL